MGQYILLVDDEMHVSHILGRRLEREGFRVRSARDGVDAIEIIGEGVPDLIISDLQMPRINGMELATKLSEAPGTAGVPIILLTARGHRADTGVVERTGIVRTMAKPFSSHEMVCLVRELLERESREAA